MLRFESNVPLGHKNMFNVQCKSQKQSPVHFIVVFTYVDRFLHYLTQGILGKYTT